MRAVRVIPPMLLIAAAGLVACSSNSADVAKTNASSAAGSAASVSTVSAGKIGGVDMDKIVNQPESRKDVTAGACTSNKTSATNVGKVKNNGDKDATYHITITFTNEKSTVISAGETDVQVKPGETKDWKVTSNFAAPSKVVCVLRGVEKK